MPEFRRCRALTVSGRMCHQRAMRAEQFCVAHNQNRHPVCPTKGGKVDMPLLEDLSAIQLVASQVAHGLFTDTLDPWRAGKILYACQIAALTVPRPARLKPVEEKSEDEPVTEVFRDLNGELLGPEQPWIGNGGRFEPTWSWEKYLYEQECERLGKPKPQTPADMPPGGWLTPEEQAQQHDVPSPRPWMMKIVERRIQEDQRGNLPPIHERKCSYNHQHCGGPVQKFTYHLVCDYCAREREAHDRIARGEDPSPVLDPKRWFDRPDKVERDPSDWAPAKAPAPSDTGEESEKTEHLDRDKVTLLELRKMADESCTLAPFVDRDCAYTMPDCQGPNSSNPCTYCRREGDNYRKLRKIGDNLDLNASACHAERRSLAIASDRSRRTRGCAKRDSRSESAVEATAFRPRNKKRASLLPQALPRQTCVAGEGECRRSSERAQPTRALLSTLSTAANPSFHVLSTIDNCTGVPRNANPGAAESTR